MTKTERYLDFMVCLLRADGQVSAEERHQLLRTIVDGLGFKQEIVQRYEQALTDDHWAHPGDLVEEIAGDLDSVGVAGLVRDAYILASADRDISEPEVQLIRDFLKVARVPEDRFEEIDAWGREAVAHVHRGATLMEPDEEE